MTDQDLQQAVSKTIAEKIVASLTEEHRAAYLTRAVTAALNSYDVKHAVEKAVAAKASEVALELVKQGKWADEIKATVVMVMGQYVAALPEAVKKTLIEALHGKQGANYERDAGLIFRNLKIG